MRISYRPEVDGLRAVAIVAVVLYHLGIDAFAGGFTGVDCFFAISGYLIFSLLYRERELTGSIDWCAFYARRITRLMPEASVLIICVVVAGYFLLVPTGPVDGDALAARRQQLTQSGAAGALWLANMHFWQYGSGYFAAWSGREPLIHLWSLGVEEQFYLVVPLMFALTALLGRALGIAWSRCAWMLLALAFLPSLALAVEFSGRWSAFYALPTRAYEFAVGAALGLWMAQPARPPIAREGSALLAVIGVAGIAGSAGWLRDSEFPAAWALLPTASTALVILGTADANPVRQLLTLRPVVYLGKISYGWYLWHWPMLVLWREYWLYDVSLPSELAVVAAALVPAAVGYHRVAELRRSTAGSSHPLRRSYRLGAFGVATPLLVCGLLSWAATARPPSPEAVALNARMNDGRIRGNACLMEDFDAGSNLPECAFGDSQGEPIIVLWGDSHAAHWLGGLDAAFRQRGIAGNYRILFGCPPGYASEQPPTKELVACDLFTPAVYAELKARRRREPIAVILAARWAGYLNAVPLSVLDRWALPEGWAPGRAKVEAGLTQVVSELTALGIPVGIIHAVPELRYHAPLCLYRWPAERCDVSADVERAYLQPSVEMIGGLTAAFGLPALDPIPKLCTSERCRATLGDATLYFDDDHLSASAIAHLREPIETFVDTLTAKSPAPSAVPPAAK